MSIQRFLLTLRWRLELWKVARKTRPVIDHLRRLKAANAGRPFCGILLVEHIGDIIACEPVVERVKELYPGAFVVWVVKAPYADLLTAHPKLDAVVPVDSLLTARQIVLSRVFDHEIDLHVNRKPTELKDFLYHNRSGDPAIDANSYAKHGNLLQILSKAAGLEPRSGTPRLYHPQAAVAAVDRLELPDHFIAVHTTSNVDRKDWPAEKWTTLAEYVLEHYDTHVVEIGLTQTITTDHSRFISLCGKVALAQSAEIVRRAAFFIGVDSGPAHMANAWQRPALLLFGDYPTDTFNPFDGYYAEHADAVILRSPVLLRELSVDAVATALEASPLWQSAHVDRLSHRAS